MKKVLGKSTNLAEWMELKIHNAFYNLGLFIVDYAWACIFVW